MSANELPPLERLTPDLAWKPWQPSQNDPWNRKWAAHLFRRAAFGAPAFQSKKSVPQLLQDAVAQGYEATLNQVLHGLPGHEAFDEITDSRKVKLSNTFSSGISADDRTDPLAVWWLYRMVYSPHPLREKMTLFWHNHFATSNAKVKNAPFMQKQNLLFRQHALGSFTELLNSISRDPAMMIWLDANLNVKGKPNENYAREVMELFTLGVGNYTEKDIREVARAFTGWHVHGDEFNFNQLQHDATRKTVLGQTGNWNGDDIARILLAQPACARFIVRKLCRWFITETADLPNALIEPLANELRCAHYDIAPILKIVLGSRLFFSHHAYRQRIKSPVEFSVELIRQLGIPCRMDMASAMMAQMGQKLFYPPNVKGWRGGKSWINAGTMLARNRLTEKILKVDLEANLTAFAEYFPDSPRAVTRLVLDSAGNAPEHQVNWLVDQLLHLDLDPKDRGALLELLRMTLAEEKKCIQTKPDNKPEALSPKALEIPPERETPFKRPGHPGKLPDVKSKFTELSELAKEVKPEPVAVNFVCQVFRNLPNPRNTNNVEQLEVRTKIARLLQALWLLPEFQIG